MGERRRARSRPGSLVATACDGETVRHFHAVNLCPSCKDDRPELAGSPHRCMDCGRSLRSRPCKPKRPSARQLTITTIADGKRFRGRTPVVMSMFPIMTLVVLGVLAAAFQRMFTSSPLVVALFAVLAALAVLWGVGTLVHYSEVDVTPSGIEIRSFPLGGRSAGTYPRERVVAFGWIRTPGPEGSGSHHVHIALNDDSTVRVPLDTEGEAQCAYVAAKLRTAFEKTAP